MVVIKKDILLPKPEQTVVPAHHGPMLGSPDGNKCYLESSQPVEAATVYTANLGLTQFYGTTTSTDACTTHVASRPTLALIGTDHTRRLPPMQQRYLHSRSTHRLRLRRLYQSQAFPFLSSARQRRHLHRQTASTLRSPATVPASRRRGVFHPAANHAITVGCACAQPDVTVVTQSLSAGPPERRPESPPAPPVHTPRI
jgi:hypothetical protein